jgi:hypothetical protein
MVARFMRVPLNVVRRSVGPAATNNSVLEGAGKIYDELAIDI